MALCVSCSDCCNIAWLLPHIEHLCALVPLCCETWVLDKVTLLGCVSGNSFINSTDVQADQFNAMAGFSNTLGEMYRWDFTTQTGAFSGVYGGYQGLISQANFIIDGYAKAKPDEKPDLFPDGDKVAGQDMMQG